MFLQGQPAHYLFTTNTQCKQVILRLPNEISLTQCASCANFNFFQFTFKSPDYTREKSLIQDFIQRQGKVRIRPLRMLLYGPPCTGKTAAMLRLSNQIEFLDQADSPLPSTGLEKPVTVELYPKAQQTSVRVTGVALDHNVIWRHQNLKQQCQILCSRSLHHASSSENFADQPTSSLSATTTRSDGKVARSITGSPPLVDKHLSSLIKAQEWGLVRDELGIEDHTVIHMVDCGGHPEFHEILPLLLEGEALSLLFFNMSYDLDQTFPVVYRGKEGPSIIKYLSEYTTSDVFQRVLTSISAVQLGHQKTPPALLVGTYFDKTDDKHVDRLESAVQKNLKSFIEKDILCPSRATEGEKCMYITILDNMGGEHPWDIDTLREVILDTVEKRFQYQDIPTSWLLLDIFLRSKYEKSPGWCTLDECIAIARDCGITQEELLGDIKKGQPGILHIIHKHYGTLLYFSKIPGLCLKVLCNPNIILHPITKLLIVRFACNQGMIETARRIQDTGEVPQVLMEEACASNSSDPIPTKEIIDLLIHHFILYKNTRSSDGTTRYFIPCLLKPDASLTQDVAHLSPSPIILVPFSTGIVPPGVFSAMVVSLSSDSHEEWIIDEEIRFRNRIRFIVHFEGRIFNVEILQHLRFLELRFLSSVPSDVLVKCRRDFWNALVNVMDTSKLNWCWGFYCPGKDQSPHPALYQVSIPLKCAPLQVQCFNKPRCQGHGIFDLERKHTLWFQVSDTNHLRTCTFMLRR